MLTLKPFDLQPASKKRVNSNHHHLHKKQVNWLSHLKQVNFGPYTVNFDPPHEEQVTFDPNTKTRLNSIPNTKIMSISTPLLKSSQFGPHSENNFISMSPHKNQVNFDPHTGTKLFRPPRKNQINTDPWT